MYDTGEKIVLSVFSLILSKVPFSMITLLKALTFCC